MPQQKIRSKPSQQNACNMFEKCLVLSLCLALAFAQTCDSNANRIDCKQYSQSTCVAAGCCWSPVNPNPNNEPWCFYANSGQAVCNADAPRSDCGYTGIQQSQCEQQLCCWDPVNPNPDNLPYCFFSNPVIQGYQVTSVSQTATGLLINLSVLDPQNQFAYGTPITPLQVVVDYDTNTRLHVKIIDPSTNRWQVPQDIIPRSPPSQAASSPQYSFTYTNSPFGFAVTRTSDGVVLFNSTVPSGSYYNGLIFKDQYLSLSTQLPSDSKIYGLAEQTQSTGLKLVPKTFTLWNHDTPSSSTNINLYGSHPFYLQVADNGNAHGVLLLNSNGMDVVYASDHLTYNVIGGVLDFYFFVGPTGDQVVQQYTSLIGLPHMFPYWSYGFHQCHFGYPNIEYVEQVVANYSAANIPLDAIWSDIDTMDVYKDFTWDPVNYPVDQVQSFIETLHQNHQQYVVILDPGIQYNNTQYASYNDLISSGGYIYDVNGDPFIGQVWPGYTIFPDFFNPAGQQFWQAQIETMLDTVPYDGLWIDMNEISNFCSGECLDGSYIPPGSTTCGCSSSGSSFLYSIDSRGNMDVYDDGEGFDPENPPYAINNNNFHSALNDKTLDMNSYKYNDVVEYDAHNMYGLTEAITTRTSLENYYKQRAFVLARSTFPSSGKWTAHWTGDNASLWPDLYYSVVALMNFNFLGIPMIGADICGFLDNTSEELCSRWIEVGAFYPFSRDHYTTNTTPQELYRWPQVAAISSFILRVRYSLIPLFYTLNFNAATQGSPVIRPLFFEFPTDSNTYSLDTQFLIGDSIMVIPVLQQGASTVNGYFPAAVWYDFYNGTQHSYSSPVTVTLSAPVTFIPLYILGGTIFARNINPGLTTYDTRMQPFNLTVALDKSGQASGSLFLDDGSTLDFASTNIQVSFSASYSGGKGSVSSSIVNLTYDSTFPTSLVAVQVLGVSSAPSSVTVNSASWSSYSYDSSNDILTLNNLTLDITSAFTINWA